MLVSIHFIDSDLHSRMRQLQYTNIQGHILCNHSQLLFIIVAYTQ